jgi:hypothetical protein
MNSKLIAWRRKYTAITRKVRTLKRKVSTAQRMRSPQAYSMQSLLYRERLAARALMARHPSRQPVEAPDEAIA